MANSTASGNPALGTNQNLYNYFSDLFNGVTPPAITQKDALAAAAAPASQGGGTFSLPSVADMLIMGAGLVLVAGAFIMAMGKNNAMKILPEIAT